MSHRFLNFLDTCSVSFLLCHKRMLSNFCYLFEMVYSAEVVSELTNLLLHII